MLVLGIDPGTAITGYGLVREENGLALVECGAITTPAGSTGRGTGRGEQSRPGIRAQAARARRAR